MAGIHTLTWLLLIALIQIYSERTKRQEKYKEESCVRKFNMADKGNMNDTVSLTVEEKPHCRH